MIRSVSFTPVVALNAAPPPRRDAAREEAPADNGAQDAFNRMLAQQRDAARQSARPAGPPPVPSQAPAPEQPPVQTPETASGTTPTRGDDAPRPDKPAARSTAAGADSSQKAAAAEADAQAEGRPAPDPIESGGNDRSIYQSKLREIERQTKLAQLASKSQPVRLPPFGPDGPPEGRPRFPPSTDPDTPSPWPGIVIPPVIECPCEPVRALQMPPLPTPSSGGGGAERSVPMDLLAPTADAGNASTAASTLQAQDDRAAAGAVAAAISAAGPAGLPAALPAAGSAAFTASTERPATPAPVELASVPGPAQAAAGGTGASAGLPGLALATPGGLAPAPGTHAAQQATLEARPGTEAFASKFSAQVSVWVREGVQEAQLQLNPAEMGPVRVAILLEGAAAQVNFTAEHALTRQALELALPTLAGSLAEAGFTLAGGGVFDQPREPERNAAESGRSAGGTSARPDDKPGQDVQRAAVARPRGVVDLVA